MYDRKAIVATTFMHNTPIKFQISNRMELFFREKVNLGNYINAKERIIKLLLIRGVIYKLFTFQVKLVWVWKMNLIYTEM